MKNKEKVYKIRGVWPYVVDRVRDFFVAWK